MDLIIKPMSVSQLHQILEIEKKSFPAPWSKRSFHRELEENPYAVYLQAEINDKIIAYVGGWIILDELHITNLAVIPEYRRHGIARKLINALIAKSKDKGAVRATLEVRVSNTPAINLYKKNGFISAGCRPNYYTDNNEDALIMWKEICDG
ncbi:MAG: ribosomal protein S18-alanine N-acetyltransferase [Halothermotrichaceae bacterium]